MHMMDDLNLVRALDALLAEGSVTGAARRLGLSQPAMSHTLSRLRDQLGDPLLVRSGRGMVPTARAEALAPKLRAALGALDAALAETRPFEPATARRTFHIGTADYGEFVLIPPLLGRLADEAPGVDLWVRRQAPEAEILRGDDWELMVGPIHTVDEVSGVRTRALFRERFVVVMRQGHPLLERPWTVESYAGARHAFIAPRGGRGGVVDSALAKLGLSRRIALAVPHFLVAPYAIASSDLVLTLAERVARAYAATLPLVIVEPPLPLPDFTMGMVWHERHQADPGHTWLRNLLVSVSESLPSAEAPSPAQQG